MTEHTAVKGMEEVQAGHIEELLNSIPREDEKPEEKEEKEEQKVAEPAEEKEAGKDSEKESKEDKKKRVVDYGAFHEERQKRKELQKKLDEEAERNKRVEERLNQFISAVSQPQEEVDPLTRVEQRQAELEKTVEERNRVERERSEALVKEQEFIDRYRESATAYAAENPAFGEAYSFLLEARKRELSKVIRDPQKLMQRVLADERSIVEEALANDENPAQALYEIALERGFKTETKPQEDKLEKTEKILKASKSLGSGGANADSDVSLDSLSAADLGAMSDADFQALVSRHKPKYH